MRDDDPAGEEVRDSLGARTEAEQIETLTIAPTLGDLNEDLRLRGLDALLASIRVQLAPQDVARFLKTAQLA